MTKKKEIKTDINLIESVKRILSEVKYDNDIVNALDGWLSDLYQLEGMYSEKKPRKSGKLI
jgi:hypothetical protein